MINRVEIFAEHYRLYKEKQRTNFETVHAIVQLAAEVLNGEEFKEFENEVREINIELKHGSVLNGGQRF